MQTSWFQMNSEDPGSHQTYICSHQNDYSSVMVQDQALYNYLPWVSITPKEKTPQSLDPLINMSDSNTPLIPQTTTDSKVRKMHRKRTSFTKKQHEELEALFSHNMFPDKSLQKKMALKFQIPESAVKNWFKNRRLKWRKLNKQQQSQKLSSQNRSGRKLPNSPQSPTSAHTSYPALSDFCSSSHTHPLGPSTGTQESIMTPSLPSNIQMQDPPSKSLEASVPALFPEAYDITQIMELYSFPDEDELTSSSFQCLYQYLSPTMSEIGEQASSFSSHVGPVIGPSAGYT